VEDVVVDTTGLNVVGSIVVAGMVIAPPVWVVVDPVAVRPRISDAVISFVHSTTTPVVEFIGIAKHADPEEHTPITKFPDLLQVPTLPEIRAMFPDVHGEEKLSVEKKSL
jgi:hypothetical protein